MPLCYTVETMAINLAHLRSKTGIPPSGSGDWHCGMRKTEVEYSPAALLVVIRILEPK
jgi:hypothetical protein